MGHPACLGVYLNSMTVFQLV